MDAPVIGASSDYSGPDKYEVSFSWRYQKSDKHYTGIKKDLGRDVEGTQVINKVNLAEVAIRRNLGKDHRYSVTVGIPYVMATRSGAVTDPTQSQVVGERTVVGRSLQDSRGFGDVTVTGRAFIWNPAKTKRGNISLGLGVKLPTGADNLTYTRRVYTADANLDGTKNDPGLKTDTAPRTEDQSIQPGDGGFGVITDVQGFWRFWRNHAALYGGATYLFNPGETNGVPTYRTRPGEEVMSIADQYLARAGASFFPGKSGIGLSIGWRLEGVPVNDVWGSSKGFRRPGYASSAEGGISYTKGAHTFSFSAVHAFLRNRQASVADKGVPDLNQGDAAFADWVWFGGYFRRF